MGKLLFLSLVLMFNSLFLSMSNSTPNADTEYERFMLGQPIGFVCRTSNGEAEYVFQRVPNTHQVILIINGTRDGDLQIIASLSNSKIILENSWGQFRFYFTLGELSHVLQEVYENKKLGIKNFSIQFDL